LRLPAHRPGATVTRPVAPPGRPAPPVPAQGGRPPRALLPGAEGGSGVRARYSRRPPLLGHVPPSRHTSARAPRPPVLPNVPPAPAVTYRHRELDAGRRVGQRRPRRTVSRAGGPAA